MFIRIWSKTKPGIWASVLMLLFIVIMALKISPLTKIIRLSFPSPFVAGLGFIGFVLGIISIFRNKDRSLSVLLSVPVGLLIIFWTAAETAFPH